MRLKPGKTLVLFPRTLKHPRKRDFPILHHLTTAVRLTAVFSLLILPLFFLTRGHTPVYAATSDNLNFQARLEGGTGAIAPDGNYNVEFKLYDASSGGTLLWTETRTGANKVRVANGYLTVNLGDVTAFSSTMPWDQQLYLTMNIGGTGSPSWDGEMSPRLKLTAVPYAFNAKTASQLVTTSGALSSTLSLQAPTVGNQVFVVPDQGAAGTYTLLTGAAANANYIQLQGSSPGTQQTGNFNISGVGIAAGGFKSPSISLGTASTATGFVALYNVGSAYKITLNVAAQTVGDATVTVPDIAGVSDTVCLQLLANCAGGGGGANTALSNLAAVAINTSLLPGVTNSINLGDSSHTWANGYFGTAVYGPLFDTSSAVALNIGTTNATSINLNQSTTVAAGKTITFAGANTASRPSASGNAGMLYYDTDTHQLLISNGSKWTSDHTDAILVAASNSSQADKDAADYVATGTNDQTTINNAFADADPAGSGRKFGKVYLFAGTYTTTDVISMPDNTTLAGAGYSTLIQFGNINSLTKNMITNSNTSGGASAATGLTIRDLRLDGNKSVNVTGTQNGIDLYRVGYATTGINGGTITSVWATNFNNYGMYFDNTGSAGTASYNQINNNYIYSNTNGLFSNGTRNVINGNEIHDNTTAGVQLTGQYNVFSSNIVQGNGSYGLKLISSSNNSLVNGNNFRNNGGTTHNEAIYLNTSTNNSITNNTISDGNCSIDCYAIDISDATSTGNYLSGNSLDTGSVNAISGSNPIYGGQLDGSANYVIQPAGSIKLNANTDVTGTLTASTSILTPSLDRAAAGTLTIGTNSTNTTAITIGSASVTTTIQGSTKVTPQTSTSTTLLCTNTGVISTCDASVVAPTATNFIQNQTASTQTAGFKIDGVGTAGTLVGTTAVQAPLFDTASAVALNIGTTNATQINLNKNVSIAANQNITFAAGTGTFDMHNSTGTFQTGSGAVSLNGDTTVASGKVLSALGTIQGASSLTLGASSSVNGTIVLKNSTNANTITIQSAAETVGSATITIPDTAGVADTVCLLTLANCLGGAGGANTALSNLASVAINTSLLPGVTNSISLGDATHTWANGYFGTAVYGPLFDTSTGVALNIGTTNATVINLNQSTALAAGKNLTFTAGAGNFDQSASTGTFKTGSGAVSINGDTTIASGKVLSVQGTATFQNSVDSTSALTVKTSSGNQVLTANTLNSSIGINTATPAAALEVTGNGPQYYNSFESGTLSPFTTNDGTKWGIASSGITHTGANILNGTNNPVSLSPFYTAVTQTLTAPGSISFYYNCSMTWQLGFNFQIDSGATTDLKPACTDLTTNTNWTLASFAVGSGSHTFTWRFQASGGASTALDIRIDDVSITNVGAIGTTALFNNGGVGINLGTGVLASAMLDVNGTIQGSSSLTLGTSSSVNGTIVLENSTNANTVTLQSGATSTSYSLTLPTALGSSGDCLSDTTGAGILGWTTCGGAGGANTALSNLASVAINTSLLPGTTNSISLGDGTHTWQYGYYGTAVYGPLFDTVAAGTLNVGTTNATTVYIATNAADHAINIGTGVANQTVAIGSTTGTSSVSIKSGSGGTTFDSYGGYSIKSSGTQTLTIGASGDVNIQPSSDSSSVLLVTKAGGAGTVFQVDTTSSGNVTTSYLTSVLGILSPNLKIDTTGSASTYTTLGSTNLTARINLGNNTISGTGNTLITGGILSGSDATARGIVLLDYRTVVHQPTIGIISSDESNIGGLSYDNTTTNLRLKNSASTVTLQGSGVDLLTATKSGTDALITLGVAGTNAGKLVFANATNANTIILQSAVETIGSTTITIPDTAGVADTICLLTFKNCSASGSAGGDLTGTYPSPTIAKLQGGTLTITTPTTGDVLNYNGSAWVNTGSPILSGNLTVSGTGVSSFAGSVRLIGSGTRPGSPTDGMLYYDTSNHQLLVYNSNTSKWQADRSTATKIIAASNASQALKDGADYVLTGTGDQTIINSALTAAAGGKVYLTEGTYNLSAAITIPNNTTLAGAGNGTLITIPNSQNGSYNMIQNTDTSTGTGVTIRDLKLDGNKSGQASGVMQGIYFTGMGAGSGTSARAGGLITNVTVNNMYGATSYGIRLVTSLNNTLTGNTAQGNNVGIMAASNNTLTGNTAQGNAIGIQALSNDTITGNTAQGNTSYGIYLATGSNNTVSGNTVQGNTNHGIYIYNDESNNSITGNTVSGNGGTGIYVYTFGSATANTISGNTVQGNTGDGIGIYDFNGPADNSFSTISNNTVSGSGGAGINLATTSKNLVTGNTIYNNGGATTNQGIVLSTANYNTISDNWISDSSCSTSCYAITNTSGASNTFSGNTYTGDGTHAATFNESGTTTVFAGQSMTQGGLDIRFKQANSTSAFNIQNANDTAVLNVDTTNGQLMVGSYNGGTNPVVGKIVIANATSANAVTFQSAAQTGNYTLSVPTLSGNATICTDNSTTACGNFIQNQTASTQTADFKISGTGTAATLVGTTAVQAPLFDTASAVALNIGLTNASSVTIGKVAGTAPITLSASTINLGIATAATTLQGVTQTTAATAGSQLNVVGATGNTSGAGGIAKVIGGTGGTTGAGGDLQLYGGAAGGGNTNGGNVTLQGGALAGSGANGAVNINASFNAATNINTGTSTGTVTIGNLATAANAVNIAAGSTGGINLQSALINVGTATVAPTIQGVTQTSAATPGVQLSILGATGNTSGAGGIVAVTGGTGGTTGAGGALNLTGGTGGATSGTGGAVTVQGGTAVGAFAGGLTTVQGGTAAATAGSNGGAVAITGAIGSATGTGGTGGGIQLTAGNAQGSAANAGGNISLTAGNSTTTAGGGAITILSGNSATGTAGTVRIDTGTGSTVGTINIGDTNAGTINIGRAAGTAVNLLTNTTLAAGKSITFTAGAGNFDQSLSTGTFSTGTGAVSLNGDTTIANGKALNVNGATTLSGPGIKQVLSATNYAPSVVGAISGAVNTDLNGAHAVYASGKYVYVVSKWSKTFSTIDVSNPANPVEVGHITDTTYLKDVKQMVVVGKYAYMVSNGNNSIEVVNISNPYAPTVVTTAELVDGTNFSGVKGIAAYGHYLVVTSETSGKIVEIDISNPVKPVISGTTSVAGAKGIYVSGKYAYLASGNGGFTGLTIFDISSGSPGTAVGSVSNAVMSMAQAVYVSGRYAYVTDSSASGYLVIVDVSNPASPAIAGGGTGYVTTANTGGLQNVVVAGNYAYGMSNNNTKMVVFDISNPAAPSELTTLTDATNFNTAQFVSMSGRYVYGVSDGNGTSYFYVIDTRGSDLVSASIGSLQSNNLQVTEDAAVMNNFNIGGSIQVANNATISGDLVGNGSAIYHNITNSTAAFQIQNASGTVLMNADSTNKAIQIGSSTTDATAVLLGLDSYNNGTDPTGFNGAMYYNSSTSKFRCYQAGAWSDCIGTGGGGSLQAAYTASTGGTTPEIKVDSTRGGVDIQDADTTISGTLFAVRASNGGGLGNAMFSVSSSGVAAFKPASDSTNIFSVQSNGSSNLFMVDSSSTTPRVYVGDATPDANTVFLVVDNSSASSDPTGTNGAIYYNTSIDKFRCYEGTSWRNCISSTSSVMSSITQSLTASTDTLITGSNVPISPGGLVSSSTSVAGDGTLFRWRFLVQKTAAGTAASTIYMRVGTTGGTADTARCTINTGTATANADLAVVDITALMVGTSASSAKLRCHTTITHMSLTTGFINTADFVQDYIPIVTFDSTPSGTKVSLSMSAGAGSTITIDSLEAYVTNL